MDGCSSQTFMDVHRAVDVPLISSNDIAGTFLHGSLAFRVSLFLQLEMLIRFFILLFQVKLDSGTAAAWLILLTTVSCHMSTNVSFKVSVSFSFAGHCFS